VTMLGGAKWVLTTVALLIVGVLSLRPFGAQAPADAHPAFEVASVKPTKIAGTSFVLLYPGGRFSATNVTLGGLIARAWGLQTDQVDGGPAWLQSDGFDIEAKAEGNPPADQIWLMLRTLLAERFKLVVRTETRELPVYELVPARNEGTLGPSLRPSLETNCAKSALAAGPLAPFDANHPPCGVLYSPIGHWIGRTVSIRTVANALVRMVGRVVIDRTGLVGTFDLDLQWTDLAALLAPVGPVPDVQPAPADGPSLFAALQEQLGLKLHSTKGPVDVYVIEHAEKATEN
jgi:uncharacterized protein (TIGR03435 family)